MPHKQEVQYHLQQAAAHLRVAAGATLKQAPADPQLVHLPAELTGNQWLVIADKLDEQRKQLARPVAMG